MRKIFDNMDSAINNFNAATDRLKASRESGMAELMAESQRLRYNILRVTTTSDGTIMTHEEIKKSLGLSDGTAEEYRAIFNNEFERELKQ